MRNVPSKPRECIRKRGVVWKVVRMTDIAIGVNGLD